MSSFKEVAYQILSENGTPLHSTEITKMALEKGLLVSAGKTPWATMNAQLVVDVNKKGSQSKFIKTGPSTFFINKPENPFVTQDEIKEEQKKQAIAVYPLF